MLILFQFWVWFGSGSSQVWSILGLVIDCDKFYNISNRAEVRFWSGSGPGLVRIKSGLVLIGSGLFLRPVIE